MEFICGNCGAKIPDEVFVIMENRHLTMDFCPCCGANMMYVPYGVKKADYKKIKELCIEAERMNTKPPQFGKNGNFWIWNEEKQEYYDSGLSALSSSDTDEERG